MIAHIEPLGLEGAEDLVIGNLYVTSSGMGGVFTVRLLSLSEQSGATCRVHEPLNPDWHNWTFCCKPRALRR